MNIHTRQLPLRSIAIMGGLLFCLCAPAVWAQETPTATPVAETPTATPVVETPTATPVVETPTATPVVETPTATPVAETPTATPTEVPESPTSTPTEVPESPTATPTEVPESPTATPTEVPESPTATPTEEPAFPLQMSVSDVSVTALQEFEVAINAGGYENVDAFQFDISFNPPLANFVGLVTPTDDDAVNAFLTESIPEAPGRVNASIVGDVVRVSAIGGIAANPTRLNSISSPEEVVRLLRLTFRAVDILELSRTSTITITNVKDDLAGAELTAGVLTVRHLESPTATPTTQPETGTATPTPTEVVVPPTATPTTQPETGTATPTPTEVVVLPTATPTETSVPVQPSATPTDTPTPLPEPLYNLSVTSFSKFGQLFEYTNLRGWYDADSDGLLNDPISQNGPFAVARSNYVASDLLIDEVASRGEMFVAVTEDGSVFSAQLFDNAAPQVGILADFKRDVLRRGSAGGIRDVELLADGSGYVLLLESGTIQVVQGSRVRPPILSQTVARVAITGKAVDLELYDANPGSISGYVLTQKGKVIPFGGAEKLVLADPADEKLSSFVDLEIARAGDTRGAVAMTKFGAIVPFVYPGEEAVAALIPADQDFNLPVNSPFFIVGFEIVLQPALANPGSQIGLMALSTDGSLHTFGPVSRLLPPGVDLSIPINDLRVVDLEVEYFTGRGGQED